jgi:subtilisin family serine protease
VPQVVAALTADPRIASAQPNQLFVLADQKAKAGSSGPGAQYTIQTLRLSDAHRLARGEKTLVAVIDSGIDADHPELDGVIAGSLDALGGTFKPHQHGTAIAGAIASRGQLTGVAPGARLLSIRAFAGSGSGGAEGTTFNVLRSLEWAHAQGARVVNLSFAGPSDKLLSRALGAARAKGVVLVAAAGNAGPKSPPLYPAADPNVIAVTATDPDDKLYISANRGKHIGVAAPGVDVLVPIPGAGYDLASGTSIAAAHVSGLAALLIERDPNLTPDAIQAILVATARDLGARGRDTDFGAGLADALEAVRSVGKETAMSEAIH